jgi:hypothetical protein
MTRYALRYPLKPGAADRLAASIAASGDPTPPPGIPNPLLSTSVFQHGDDIVRVFDIDGELDDIVALLAGSPAVQHMGNQMAGLLVEDYDLGSPSGLRRFFTDNLMRTVTDRVAAEPAGSEQP